MTGLRDRKKADRRQKIIDQARILFDLNGFEATTMAGIAEAVGVSPPTIFNYFGTKDAILVAMISEGIARTHDTGTALPEADPAEDTVAALVRIFVHLTEGTMEIASRSIWRYAEASVIRHPETELSQAYNMAEDRLKDTLAERLKLFDLRMANGTDPDHTYLAGLFHDIWNLLFFRFIRDDTLTIADHRAALQARIAPLADMVFAG